jgi:secreted trypsin-like serine protease
MKLRNLLLALAAILPVGAAHAITYGVDDNGKHPFVGGLVGTFSGQTFPYCSGTLIAPTVFLTAAHCDIGQSRVYVGFEANLDVGSTVGNPVLHTGTYIANPAYTKHQNDPHDIAVVILDTPITDVTPARLPTLNQFDNIAHDQKFTVVGYGGQERVIDHAKPVINYLDNREYSVAEFNAVGPGYIRLSQNAATGNGGACFGDSGGPNFFGAGDGETNVIAGTTITGDTQCVATNVIERMDTADSRAFLAQYVTLP